MIRSASGDVVKPRPRVSRSVMWGLRLMRAAYAMLRSEGRNVDTAPVDHNPHALVIGAGRAKESVLEGVEMSNASTRRPSVQKAAFERVNDSVMSRNAVDRTHKAVCTVSKLLTLLHAQVKKQLLNA